MIADIWQDLRYGARMLARKPGFALVAVMTLALGIGANTAIFTVVNAVLLQPLPYAEPERLVALGGTHTRTPGVKDSISYPDFVDWRERNRSFESLAVYRSGTLTMTGTETPVNLTAEIVSAGLFDLLGARPQLGRVFTPGEDQPGFGSASYAAVISDALWRRHFGADPQLPGRVVTLDHKAFEIVGVMKPGFQFPIQAEAVEVWVTPAILSGPVEGKRPETERRGYRSLEAIARLKRGVSLEQAQSDMNTVSAGLEKEYPDNNSGNGAILLPLHGDLTGAYRSALLVVFAAIACVLLIACANLANLLLSNASTRSKEIAVRAALGASRARIIRQLLAESILLAIVGGAFGLLLASIGLDALLNFLPADLPRLGDIDINRSALAFTFIVSLVTGVVFGLAPALQASKIDLSQAMKDGARAGGGSGSGGRVRSALIVAEVALAAVLLISASLLLQTFRQLQRVDLGFDTRNVLSAQLAFSETAYAKPEQKVAFVQGVVERVRTLPGVVSASSIVPLPLTGDDAQGSFQFEGQSVERGSEPTTQVRWVSHDYYSTMRIPFLAGRDFTPNDDLSAPPVTIVNQSFVRKYLPNEDPLRKRLQLPIGVRSDATTFEIIGIVQDVKHRTELREAPEPELYLSYAQMPFFSQSHLVIRTRVSPGSLALAVQREVSALDREAVLSNVKTLDQYLSIVVSQPRFSAMLFGLFALLALVLGAIGLYGVMAYSVTQRTHEIGIRLALGAQTRDVLRLIIRQGMVLAVGGVFAGLGAALALTRLLSSLLFGVSASDPFTFAAIAVLLLLVALTACWIPAKQATRVDPLDALRCQ